MATSAISAATATSGVNGINLDSFLKIVLAQLTYQDPLKPVDSAQFVTQLAQMTSLQQTVDLTTAVNNVLAVDSATQLISLLGKTVQVATSTGTAIGKVTDVTFQGGTPQFSITDSATATVLSNITADKIILVQP
jgi:flagellar basal-body rod modification protein FlgD